MFFRWIWEGKMPVWFHGALTVVLAGVVWIGTPMPGGAAQLHELAWLIDSPTAGLVEKGKFGFDLRMFPNGGLMAQLRAGALKRLTIGVSYGGEQLIGDQPIDWYPRLEAAVRYRLVEESHVWPALVAGYETQGYGAYHDKRYRIKSKGLFLSLSKNYLSSFGQFGVHGGINLTREHDDGDDDPSGWVGVDKRLNEELVFVAEYDLGLNDNSRNSLGTGEGYLNAGVRWLVVPQLTLGVYLKNLLGSGLGDTRVSRELSVSYFEEF